MKFKWTLILPALLLAAGTNAQTLSTNTYSETVNTIVPDDNPNGLASTMQISGSSGSITGISVSLDITDGYNGDFYAYLADPGGDFAVLLNRVGVTGANPFGYSDSGFDISLSSAAANNIHFYQSDGYMLNGGGQLTGTWAPDGRNIDPGAAPAAFDTAGTPANFDSFLGNDANGTWTLFIADISGGYEGTLVNWSMTVMTTPEPTSFQLLGMAGLAGGLMAWYRWRFK